MSSVDATLDERETRYGQYAIHSAISQGIKREMRESPNWEKLNDVQKESLEMIAHKIARVLNGDPNYADNYHDIAGYASLVERDLSTQGAPGCQVNQTNGDGIPEWLKKTSYVDVNTEELAGFLQGVIPLEELIRRRANGE